MQFADIYNLIVEKKKKKKVEERVPTKKYYDDELDMHVHLYDEKGVITVADAKTGEVWFQRDVPTTRKLMNLAADYKKLEQFDSKTMDNYFISLESDIYGSTGKGTSNPTERFATIDALKKYFNFGVDKVYFKDR